MKKPPAAPSSSPAMLDATTLHYLKQFNSLQFGFLRYLLNSANRSDYVLWSDVQAGRANEILDEEIPQNAKKSRLLPAILYLTAK